MAEANQIPISSLTEDELQALEARGVDTSKGGSVPVPQPGQVPRATVGATVLPTAAPVEAPAPPPDVVARARERLAAAQSLSGDSAYEIKSKTGAVLEKSGEIKPEASKPPEDVIEETDKASFLIAMLGGAAFHKEYKLYGGKITVTFKTRSAAVDALCASQAYRDDEFDSLINVEVQARQQLRMNRYFDYQFVTSLHSITAPGSPPRAFDLETVAVDPKVHGTGASKLRAMRLDLDKELAQPFRVAMRSVHSKFENLVAKMTMEANNPDFWQADSET